MIHSMTAFARVERRDEWGSLAWELRSLNHRYLELSLRLPEELRPMEALVRERATVLLGRGKVECALFYRPSSQVAGEMAVNRDFTEKLLAAVQEVELLQGVSASYSPMELLRWPGVLESVEADMTPVIEAATGLLDGALEELKQGRAREGEKLKALIEQRCASIESVVEQVKSRLPQILAAQRERLRSRLAEVSGELDSGRLEQEMVIIAQKSDVDEELDRLMAHVAELREVLQREEPVGRRLDFLMQEFNREANTLGSKSSDAELTRSSVELKVLIEQMREQIQNIE
ncbi:YicC family protein [Solemya pervernicosa gill symbiont]|uniref:YicC family protein n=2 Tax=Gammaproteobacteria incertae sedis TaxID=118884 RepID=A0A1T2LB33_9GAMM|nr:YicC/YloC family endoribonuclease [Candidatus Reidiella endopervernicosa]OOZ42307.1 YicC family protein [Solemya pervernicosa gill symbiont]QKQ25703.1 YicC family protein [Candidatus Reidiella endopervernicosa]